MNKVYKAKINCGIGDIIYARSFLQDIVNEYDKIYLSNDLRLIKIYKNDDIEFKEFTNRFMKIIFNDSKFKITLDQSYPKRTSHSFVKDGLNIKIINLANVLVLKEFNHVKNYIVLHTKVRSAYLTNNEINNILILIKNKLKNYNIIILGEKQIDSSNEYLLHNNNILCIYNNIISVFGKNIIDMTISNKFENVQATTRINNILNDCSIMKNAKFNLVFGIGGDLALSSAVGNVICYLPLNGKREFEYMSNKLFNNKNTRYIRVVNNNELCICMNNFLNS